MSLNAHRMPENNLVIFRVIARKESDAEQGSLVVVRNLPSVLKLPEGDADVASDEQAYRPGADPSAPPTTRRNNVHPHAHALLLSSMR